MSPMEIELGGANGTVFPALITWGWEIALYLFLGGLVAGMMMLSGTFRLARRDAFPQALKIADLTALPLLAVGLLLLIVDLSQAQNVWRLYTTFQVTSPMSWGAWILLLAMVVLALWFASRLAPISPERFWTRASGKKAALRGVRALFLKAWALAVSIGAWARGKTRLLAVATAILGVCLGFYTGLLLSTISARPLWNTAALAPLFLVSGLASGGAFLCLFLPRDEHDRLAPVSVAACAVELAILLAFALTLATGTAAAQRAIGILTGGTLGVVFVGIAIGLGLLVPFVVESFEVLHRRLAFVPARLPPVLKLGGGVALRLAIVYAGMLSFV